MALDDPTAALLAQLSMARPEMAHVMNTRVKAAGGAVPVRVLLPAEHPRGVTVYYHGGG
jgi:acetyl esterase/lipase